MQPITKLGTIIDLRGLKRPQKTVVRLRILAIHGAKTTKNQTPLVCFA